MTRTVVSFWTHTHPPMVTLLRDLVAEYEAAHPDIEIDYRCVPNAEWGTTLLDALTAGTGPDVLNQDDSPLRSEYIARGLLAPLDPAAFGVASVDDVCARYQPGTLAGAMGSGGVLYGLPSAFNGTALAINAAHFAEAGIDPDRPMLTWDDLEDAARRLIAAGHPQAFSFLYLTPAWYAQEFKVLLHQTGGHLAHEGKGALDSPESLQALRLWARLAAGEHRTADPAATRRDLGLHFADLASGAQSMALMYTWAMDQVQETNPETFREIRLLPLPQVDSSHPSTRVYSYYWAVSAGSTVTTESWRFVDFLTTRSERFLRDCNFVQPLVGWQQTPAAREVPFIDVWARSFETGSFDEMVEGYSEISGVITRMIDAVVFAGADVEGAAARASHAVTEILART
jgi:multiple sugar transport system substrate-binding protein